MELFIKNNKIWQTLLFILIYLSFHQSILIAEENQHFEIQHDKFKYLLMNRKIGSMKMRKE